MGHGTVSRRRNEIAWAAALLAALAAHAVFEKWPDKLPELLWVCHVATALMAVGLLARIRLLLAVGFLFHLAVGWWAWLLDVFATGTTTVTSTAVHVLPLVIGWLALGRKPLPNRAIYAAAALYIITSVACLALTPPALNVNVVFAPWPPLASTFENIHIYRATNAATAIALLAAARLAWRLREVKGSQ